MILFKNLVKFKKIWLSKNIEMSYISGQCEYGITITTVQYRRPLPTCLMKFIGLLTHKHNRKHLMSAPPATLRRSRWRPPAIAHHELESRTHSCTRTLRNWCRKQLATFSNSIEIYTSWAHSGLRRCTRHDLQLDAPSHDRDQVEYLHYHCMNAACIWLQQTDAPNLARIELSLF